MKIAILYPPITKEGKYPHLGQNRQFRYTSSNEVRIFPLVPATAATLLSRHGHEVLFLDGINRRLSGQEFDSLWQGFDPDVVVIETKAPIIKKHWKFIDSAKVHSKARFVLVGDHVSFFPEESLERSKVDFCLTGGDYDYGLLQLVDFLEGKSEPSAGLYFREDATIQNSGPFKLLDDLDSLPFIDRKLTRWQDYGEAYLHRPCAYILSGRGCGGGKYGPGICTFCIWQHAFWKCRPRLRSPGNVVRELKSLVEDYRVREVFDDNESGAIWDKDWLKEFQRALAAERLVGKVIISSNARADSLDEDTCRLLKKCGFRLLKIGLESGCEKTLARLRKRETLEEITAGVKRAKDFGLRVLLTIMVGYPWENEEDVYRTLLVARELILYKCRFGDTLQASIIIPYPGTPLYEEAKSEGWLKESASDYESFDMNEPVLKTEIDPNLWCRRVWKIYLEPGYLLKSLASLRSWQDLKLALRGVISLTGHLKDYAS